MTNENDHRFNRNNQFAKAFDPRAFEKISSERAAREVFDRRLDAFGGLAPALPPNPEEHRLMDLRRQAERHELEAILANAQIKALEEYRAAKRLKESEATFLDELEKHLESGAALEPTPAEPALLSEIVTAFRYDDAPDAQEAATAVSAPSQPDQPAQTEETHTDPVPEAGSGIWNGGESRVENCTWINGPVSIGPEMFVPASEIAPGTVEPDIAAKFDAYMADPLAQIAAHTPGAVFVERDGTEHWVAAVNGDILAPGTGMDLTGVAIVGQQLRVDATGSDLPGVGPTPSGPLFLAAIEAIGQNFGQGTVWAAQPAGPTVNEFVLDQGDIPADEHDARSV